jgi:hypothetical protein
VKKNELFFISASRSSSFIYKAEKLRAEPFRNTRNEILMRRSLLALTRKQNKDHD